MKCIINTQVVLSRPPEGPLAGYSDGDRGVELSIDLADSNSSVG